MTRSAICAAAITAAAFLTGPAQAQPIDLACAGWEIDRALVLRAMERRAQIRREALNSADDADAATAAIIARLTEADRQAMADFMETKRIFDRRCQD